MKIIGNYANAAQNKNVNINFNQNDVNNNLAFGMKVLKTKGMQKYFDSVLEVSESEYVAKNQHLGPFAAAYRRQRKRLKAFMKSFDNAATFHNKNESGQETPIYLSHFAGHNKDGGAQLDGNTYMSFWDGAQHSFDATLVPNRGKNLAQIMNDAQTYFRGRRKTDEACLQVLTEARDFVKNEPKTEQKIAKLEKALGQMQIKIPHEKMSNEQYLAELTKFLNTNLEAYSACCTQLI